MPLGTVPGAPVDARAAERALRRKNAFAEAENMDPMSGIANIADVFLVLMVGFLIAFITMSGIPLADLTKIDKSELTEVQDPETITDDMKSGSGLEEQKNSTVYKDPDTGTIYILEEGDE